MFGIYLFCGLIYAVYEVKKHGEWIEEEVQRNNLMHKYIGIVLFVGAALTLLWLPILTYSIFIGER